MQIELMITKLMYTPEILTELYFALDFHPSTIH